MRSIAISLPQMSWTFLGTPATSVWCTNTARDMVSRRMRWFALLLLLSAIACSKPSVQECETLCTRYSELSFSERETETRPKEEVEASWKEYAESEVFKKGLHNCVNDCRYGGSKSDLTCVKAAKTVAEANTCLE